MTLNPYAECFAPDVVDKKIQIVLNPSASTFYPQNPEKTSNENKQADLRLNPHVKEFSPKERCQCSMNLKSSNPCNLLYPSNFNDFSAVNLVNSALFVSNSAIDENDDDMTKFCNSSMKLWTKQRVDSHPPDTSMTALNPLALDFTPEATRLLSEQNFESDNPLDRTPPICDTMLDITPSIFDLETPDISFAECQENKNRAEFHVRVDQNDGSSPTLNNRCDETNPNANQFVPILVDFNITDSTVGNVSVSEDMDDPKSILEELKQKNIERPVIAHLNINSISSKFEPLMSLVKDNVDFLVITESKIDDTFPLGQFQIEGFARPIRLDRTRNGGGVIIFIRDDLTCHELTPRVLYPELECTFLEMRIRQSKWLVVAGYNPHKENTTKFLNAISEELDKLLPKYENLLALGDWNSEMTEESMENFCEMYNLENLIKEPTCFKSTENPSSIDIILTNKKLSFQNSMTIETGLSDFHKMTVTVMKKFFKKKEPIKIIYHDRKNFNAVNFEKRCF